MEKAILDKLNSIMSVLTDLQTSAQAAFDKISADITALSADIVALQNSPGQLTPADQAAVDKIQAGVTALQATADAAAAAIAATPKPPTP